MKKILILNGSPRKNGKTAALVNAFVEGAESAGNEVKSLYLQGMNIKGCIACEACSRNGGICSQKNDDKNPYANLEPTKSSGVNTAFGE